MLVLGFVVIGGGGGVGGDVCNSVNFIEVSRTSSQKKRQKGNKPALFVPQRSMVFADGLEIEFYPIWTLK